MAAVSLGRSMTPRMCNATGARRAGFSWRIRESLTVTIVVHGFTEDNTTDYQRHNIFADSSYKTPSRAI